MTTAQAALKFGAYPPRSVLTGEPGLYRDRLFGLVAAFLLHAVLFSAGGAALYAPARYGVAAGDSSIEIDLVAAPTTEAALKKVELVSDEPAVIVAQKTEAQKPEASVATFHASRGARTLAQPNYLKNPPPAYPETSRRMGEQGVVLLSVVVDERGRVADVVVKQSSGFSRLDQAALDAVGDWRFHAARFGSVPIASRVEVPVRFSLKGIR